MECNVQLGDQTFSCPTTVNYTAPPVCGNGIQEPPEVCDDGNTVDDDTCTNACTIPG